jgi:hypothetical protein
MTSIINVPENFPQLPSDRQRSVMRVAHATSVGL